MHRKRRIFFATCTEQHLTEANAEANMFNGLFIQETAHAFSLIIIRYDVEARVT